MVIAAMATVRARWATFVGTFAVLALGVSVIATVALVLAAAWHPNAHRHPQRFAGVRFVIQAKPSITVRDRYGSIDSVPLTVQPAVPASVIRELPGAAPDRSFFAQVAGVTAAEPTLGHGWSSAAFAPYALTSGHPPRSEDQIVVAAPARIGRRASVITDLGSRLYTIVGTVRPRPGELPIFFTDAEAARLSPAVDALTTDAVAVARRAVTLTGGHLRVLAGAARHDADPDAVQDSTELTGLTAFLGVAALIAAFVAIAVTAAAFGLAVTQRRRDLALLRNIGATPRQLMRLIAIEAALVGAAASATGCVIGLMAAPALVGWIVRQGLAPAWFEVSFATDSAVALAASFAVGVAVAVLSVGIAAIRIAAIRPSEALREAAVAPKPISGTRLIGGLLSLGCGLMVLVAVVLVFPSAATDPQTVAEIIIPLVAGAALLAPWALRPLTRPFVHGTSGMLLRAHIQTAPRRSAAITVPVLLTVGLATAILGANGTANAAAAAAERQLSAGASLVILPGETPGITTSLTDRIERIKGVQASAIADATMLAYPPQITSLHLEAPMPIPTHAIGVDHPSAALRLNVAAGSLTKLNDHTIAVSSSWHKHVGDMVRLWQADGTPLSLRVIAVLSPSGLATPDMVVNLHNSDVGVSDRIYARPTSARSRAALLAAVRSQHARAVPVSRWSADASDRQARENEVGLELLIGIAVAYSIIGVVSAVVSSVAGRRSELTLLATIGATRRQVVWITTAEALVLTVAGIALSAIVASVVIAGLWIGLRHTAGSASVSLPWPFLASIPTGCFILAGLLTAIPTWLQSRSERSPPPG